MAEADKIQQAKDGLAYEVILERPVTPQKPRPTSANNTPGKKSPRTAEDIQKKLKEAEDRRMSLEASRIKEISDRLQRIEEVAQARQQRNDSFSKAAEEKLQAEMEAYKENRDAQMTNMKERLKEHEARCTAIRRQHEQSQQVSVEVLREKINQKLELAEENRSAQLKELFARLKEHEKRIEEVRTAYEDESKSKQIHDQLLNKMGKAMQKKEMILNEIMDRMREHDRHADTVREKRSSQTENGDEAEVAAN